jgi:sulfotransferase
MDKIFFQSSIPRSGSTLLQNIMGQNPDFYVTPTSPLFEAIFSSKKTYSFEPTFKALNQTEAKSAFIGYCKGAMCGYFEALTDKKFVLDKSRGWLAEYNFLESVLNQKPKIICTVRDLRDVFCSFEKLYRREPLKANLFQDWNTLSGTTVQKRVDINAGLSPLGLHIDRLVEIFRLKEAKNILFIKYEDLCLYPETEIKRVYDYLEVPFWEHHNFDNVEQITFEDDKLHAGLTDHTINSVVKMSPSNAIEILGEDVCEWIYNNYKWFFEFFEYQK